MSNPTNREGFYVDDLACALASSHDNGFFSQRYITIGKYILEINVANMLNKDIPTTVDRRDDDAIAMWRLIHHGFIIADGVKLVVAKMFRVTIFE